MISSDIKKTELGVLCISAPSGNSILEKYVGHAGDPITLDRFINVVSSQTNGLFYQDRAQANQVIDKLFNSVFQDAKLSEEQIRSLKSLFIIADLPKN